MFDLHYNLYAHTEHCNRNISIIAINQNYMRDKNNSHGANILVKVFLINILSVVHVG